MSVQPPLPPTKFYFASAYHLPGIDKGGADVAATVIKQIEAATGWKCTSHWPFDFRHGEAWFAKKAAETDLQDIRDADILIFAPTTGTSRGTHVELGFALALGKKVYGWRPKGIEGTAFDTQCEPLPWHLADLIATTLANAQEAADERERDAEACAKLGIDQETGRPL